MVFRARVASSKRGLPCGSRFFSRIVRITCTWLPSFCHVGTTAPGSMGDGVMKELQRMGMVSSSDCALPACLNCNLILGIAVSGDTQLHRNLCAVL